MAKNRWTSSERVNQLLDWAVDVGFTVDRRGTTHICVKHSQGGQPVFCSGSPSDRRVYLNIRADLRRVLRQLQEEGKVDSAIDCNGG